MPESTDAIVLSGQPYRETSLLVALLTPGMGVVRGLARGVRGAKKTSPCAFESLARVHCAVYAPRTEGLSKLGGVEMLETWPGLRKDVARLAYAELGVELAGTVAAHSPHEPYFYDEALTFLQNIEATEGPGSLTIALALRLMCHAGFPPRLADGLNVNLLPDRLAWDFQHGAFFALEDGLSARSMQMPREAVAAILPWCDNPPSLTSPPRLAAGGIGPALLRWIVRAWEDHLDTKLKSMEFLEKMVLSPH